MIFNTNDNGKLTIFGQQLTEIIEKARELRDVENSPLGSESGGGFIDSLINAYLELNSAIKLVDENVFEKFKEDYDNLGKNDSLEDFISKIKESDETIGNYFSELDGGKASYEGYVSHTEQAAQSTGLLTIKEKIAAGATKALAGVLNMLGGILIGLAINAVIKGIDELIHGAERAAEDAKNFVEDFKSMEESTAKNSAAIKELSDEYEKLSKGVDSLGNNISLTSDEFDRYHEIVKQIKDICPDLVTGYDDQGNAIINLTDKVKGLGDAYEETLKKQARSLYDKKNSDGDNLTQQTFKDAKNKLRQGNDYNLYSKLQQLQKLSEMSYEEALSYYETIGSTSAKDLGENEKKTLQLLKEAGFNPTTTADTFGQVQEELIKGIEDTNVELETVANEISDVGLTYAQTLDSYWDLADDSQKNIAAILKNLSPEYIKDNELFKKENLEKFAYGLITKSDIDSANSQIEKLLGLREEDLNIPELKERLQSALKDISESLSTDDYQIDESVLHGLFGTAELDRIIDEYDTAINATLGRFSDVSENDLQKFFNANSINTQEEIDRWNEIIETANSATEAKKKYLEEGNKIDTSSTIEQLTTQITSFKTAQESLTTALSEQSSTGTISNETLATLKENYEGIENAIEFTTDGIILNTSKLRDLNAEQRKNTADELAKKEEDLTKQYQEATLKLAEYDKLSKEHSDENDNLKSVYDDLVNSQQNEVNALDDEIAGLKALQKEYNNSISTHNAFMEALSSPNEGAGYESIVSSLEKVQQQWDKGLYGTDDIRTFVDYMTSADMSNASVDEIMNQYEKAMETAKQFFTENKDGSRKFLELLQETSIEVDGVTQSLATYDEASNKWNIDIQDMAKASEATGYSTDFLIDNLNRLKDFGFNVVFGETDDFTNYKQAIDDVNKEIEDTQSLLDAFGGKSEGLKNKLQELNETKVNLEDNIPTSAVDEAIEKIQQLQTEIQTLQTIPGITSADIDKKRQQQADIAKTAGIELTAVIGGDTEKAEVAAENLKKAIEDSTATMLVDANVKPAQDAINAVVNATYTANLKLRLSTVNATDVNNVINKIKENASSGGATAYGTANIGKSFAGGSIGTNKTLHNVMVSEVQPEMVVDPSSGQYTIYKYPTMLDTLPKNSIVFNGKQTSEILKNGMTTSYGKALASGTLTGVSFVKTTAKTSGSGNLLDDKSSTSKSNNGNNKTKGKSNNNDKKNKSNKSEIDWIARKLERLQSIIDLTRAKFENLFNIDAKKSNLDKQIEKTTKLQTTNEKAVDKYQKKAANYAKKTKYTSGKNKGKKILTDGLIKKIQNGQIKGSAEQLIKEYGEQTYNAIIKYQDYWDKARNAEKAAEEAITKQRELQEEKYQLYIDEAEANLDNINALSEINRNYARGKEYLEEQIKWINQKYDYEIEIAKLNKDEVKEKQLVSEKEKEITEAKKTQLQLYVDDSEAEISKLDALIDISTSYKQSNKYLDEQKKHIQDKYKYEIEIAKLEKDITKEHTLQKQLQKELLKIEKSKFDNIQQYYDTQLDFVQEMYSLTDKQIELIETKGAVVNSGYYKDQQKIENEKLQTYNEELKSLKDQAAVLEQTEGGKYSEEWIACQKAILSVNSAIADTTINLSELNNKINENTKAMIDRVLGIGDRAIKENNFIGDLTSDIEDFNTVTHQMTTEGLTRLQTYSKNMNIAASEASYLGDIVKKLESAYDKGKMTVDLGDAGVFNFESFNQMREYIDEFYDSWQDKIKETNEYQSKIIDFMRNKLKEELAALNEIIDAKSESLNAEKELRNYQKSIREQTTNIGLLQKQMTGVSGDTSEEGIARYLNLQKQLSDAEQQLEETEFDHVISEMQASLDKLSEEYSATIDALSSNTGYLLEEGNQILTNNGVLISEFTDRLCGDNGYIVEFKQFVNEFKTATDALTSGDVSILNALIGNENSIISAINADKDAVTKLPNYTTSLSEIKSILEGIKEHVNPINSGNNDNNSPTTTTPDNSQSPSMSAGAEGNNAVATLQQAAIDNNIDANKVIQNAKSASVFELLDNMTGQSTSLLNGAKQEDEWDKKKKEVEAVFANSKYYAAGKKKKASDYETKINQYLFSKNKKVLSSDGLAQLRKILGTTNDNLYNVLMDLSKMKGNILNVGGFAKGGIGKLVKPTGEDGLTWVRNGEGFVRPEDVKHIQELLNVVPDVKDIIKPVNMPNIQPVNNNSSIGDIKFNIEMNGVNDVETFSKQIREAYCSDEKIRKMIQSDNIMQLKSNSKSYNRNMYR